jgi:hypothetical protein
MRVILKSLCVIAFVASGTAFADTTDGSREVSAQRRARVTVYPAPNYPGPNAVRHCESWLQKEYRPSGTVVTPQMRCYWR